MSATADTDYTSHGLEKQLKDADETHFPTVLSVERGNTKSYKDRYDILKTKLGHKHDFVEFKATLCSLEDELNNNTSNDALYDKLVFLNRHGKGHIEKVISRASDLVNCIIGENSKLIPFEVFILLCAIQIHDIGNMYGRENHTVSFKNDFYKLADESFIIEGVLKNCIFDIAKVHSGKINNDADTIEAAMLRHKIDIMSKGVRQRLLAAILRFADELADDHTRVFDIPIFEMPDNSKIFHAYSQSLHTVKIEKNENANYVKLCYFMSLQDALQNYKKLQKNENGNLVATTIRLIREIIERTKKMERERRYCSRHFLPHIIIEQIKVEIEIDMGGIAGAKRITYTLHDIGYPGGNIQLPQTVEDDIAQLEQMNVIIGG